MSNETIYHWRVYCTTDAKYEYMWGPTQPTVCPSNPSGHTIDASQTTSVEQRDPNRVQLEEELVSTQGIYRYRGYKSTIAASTPGTVETIDVSWPDHPITLLNGSFDALANQVGDELSVVVAPQQIIGALTADPAGNVLSVSPTVLENMYVGFEVYLYDGVNLDHCGICTNVDKLNATITVKTAPVHTFSAATPTYVMMSVYVIESLHIGSPQTYQFARKKNGGKAIPAGVTIRIMYTNNDGLAKDLHYNLEYMY